MQIYSVRFIPFCDNSRLPQKQGIISTSLMIILASNGSGTQSGRGTKTEAGLTNEL